MLTSTKLKNGRMTVTDNGADIGFGEHDLIGSFGDLFVVRTDTSSKQTAVFSAKTGKCLIPDVRLSTNSNVLLPVDGLSSHMVTSSAIFGIITSGFYGSPTTRGTIQIRRLLPENDSPTKVISAGFRELNLTAGLFMGQSEYVVGKKTRDATYGIFTKRGKRLCESDDFHELSAGFVEGKSAFARVYVGKFARILNVKTGKIAFEVELPFQHSISERGLVSDGFQNGVAWTSIDKTFFAIHENGVFVEMSSQVQSFLAVNDNDISSNELLALATDAVSESKRHRLL